MFWLIVRSGTPHDLVQRIYTDIAVLIRTSEIKERMQELGMDPIGSSPEEFNAFLRRQMAKCAPVVKASAATVN